MSNLNNEERLKILRARLDEIQQKNFSTENVENEKEKVVETPSSTDKNTSNRQFKKQYRQTTHKKNNQQSKQEQNTRTT